MTYAPVCIPTLNRYEHLRKCLESLQKCTWAEETEVYVALDYPPTDQWEKYAPGWEKNRDWLRSIGNFGFKKLHLIEREKNYGTWLPGQIGNGNNLVTYISSMYDCYIFTEDDNIFAPCFLEYINKGLELFENDESVQSISGYKFYYATQTDDNTYIRQSVDYSPWGVGLWTKKIHHDIYAPWFRSHVNFKRILLLRKLYGWAAVATTIEKCCRAKTRGKLIDNDHWAYLQVTNKQQIVPAKTLVQNIGLDGSGLTMVDAIGHQEWCDPALNPLSTEEHFEFVGTGYERFDENRRIYYQGKYGQYSEWYYFKKAIKKFIKLIVLDIKR